MKKYEYIELVGSLTGPEKRYFKLMAARQEGAGGNDYIRLFDHLDACIRKGWKHDKIEQDVREFFGAEADSGRFQRLKHYMVNQLLEALRLYHKRNSIPTQIAHLIHEAEILEKKALFSLAMARAEKAIRMARDNFEFAQLFQAIRTQRQITTARGNYAWGKSIYARLYEDERDAIAEFDMLSRLNQDYREVFYEVFEDVPLDDRTMPEVMMEKWKAEMQKGNSAIGPILYHTMMAYIYQHRGDFENAMRHTHRQIREFEGLPDRQFRQFELGYNAALYNYVTVLSMGQDEATFFREFDKIISQHTRSKRTKEHVLLNRMVLTTKQLLVAGAFGRFAEIEARYDAEIDAIGKDNRYLWKYLHAHLNFALLNFASGDVRKAAQRLHQLMNTLLSRMPASLVRILRVLQVMCDVELAEPDLLDYHLTAARRWMRSAKPEGTLTRWIFRNIVGIEKAFQTGDRAGLEGFAEALNATQAGSDEGTAVFDGLDVAVWLQHLRDGESYAAAFAAMAR